MNIKNFIPIILFIVLNNNYIFALPKNPLQKAIAAMELGLFNEALKQIEIAKITNPKNAEVYRLKALLHEANGDYNKAIHEWQVGMSLHVLHGEFPGLIEKAKAQAEAAQHCHEGDHDMESKQYSNAAAAYKLSMQLDPSNIEYKTKYDEATQKQQSLDLKERGEHLMKDGDFEAACSCFQEALQLTPNDDALRNDETTAQHEMQAKKIRDAEAAERAEHLRDNETPAWCSSSDLSL